MHERIVGLYEENAAAWAAHRGTALFEGAWLDGFAGLLPSGASVLDLGCGSGEPIAAELMRRGFSITGVDSSPSLIAICKERLPQGEWLAGDMRALALPRRFSGIIAWHSFFHLSPADQRPMFERFAGHLMPGGALMFTSGTQEGEALGEWQGEPLYHGSLSTSEYRALLDSNGFEVVEHRADDPECGYATVWLAQMRPASGLDGSA